MSYKLDKKKSNKISKIITTVGLLATLLSTTYIGIHFFTQYEGIKNNEQIINQITINEQENQMAEEYTPKYDITALQNEYPNAWGILEMPNGTALPIASATSLEDEDYYSNHALDGSYSSAGTLFLDHTNYQNEDQTVRRIWGHNLTTGNMFGDLTEFQNQGQEYYNNNQAFTLYTNSGVYELQVFAGIEEDATNHEFNYPTEEDFLNDMYNAIENSNFTSNVTINPNDRIIILGTCPDRGSQFSGNNRFSVYTKVVPIYENTINQSKTL